jgi:hypothetical protein
MTWHCDVTKNPVGTDTVMIGAPPCDCQGCRAAARIEALETALNYVADMTYYGGGAEWHFKLGYDPQEVLYALAPEPEK